MHLKRIFFMALFCTVSTLALIACGKDTSLSQTDAERVFGHISAAAGVVTGQCYDAFTTGIGTDSPITFTSDSSYDIALAGSPNGAATGSGTVSYTPHDELEPERLAVHSTLSFTAYAIDGLIIDGTLTFSHDGSLDRYTRTFAGDFTISGALSADFPIDLEIVKESATAEWDGEIGGHVYSADAAF